MAKKEQLKLSQIITPQKALVYLQDPVRFVQEVIFNKNWAGFGGKYEVTDQQREILMSVANNNAISVRAGRGIGKTGTLSWIILWQLCVKKSPKVVATAPSFPQLQSVLWPEVKQWLDKSLVKDCFTYTKRKLYRNDNELAFAEPRTASKEEAAQGLHNDHLLIIADEATGIEDSILETLEGSLTGESNKVILMFNPTRISGYAYDTHNANKDDWAIHHFSSENSNLVDKKWLRTMKNKYIHGSVIHDVYRVHVLGEFPKGDPKAFFTLEEIYAARDRVVDQDGVVEIGIDVAAEGDDETVFCPRWGNYVMAAKDFGVTDCGEGLWSWGKTRIPETEQKIYDGIRKVREATGYEDTIRVKIDAGGLGIGLVHHLEDHAEEHDIEIVRVNFGGSGKDYEYDANEATHMWNHLKEIIDDVQLPYDQFLMDELVSRRWNFATNGKQCVESKKIYKKEFKSSPDRADAVILAFADYENERLYIKSFAAKKNRKRVDGHIIEHTGERYCGVHCSPTGIMSVVMASFNGRALGVYRTITGTVEEVIRDPEIRAGFSMLIGSKNMFGDGDSISLKMHMNGIPVIEPFLYDETGSVFSLDAMSKKGAFVVANECVDMEKQLETWTVDKQSVKLQETHGLCYALVQIVSALKPSNTAAFCMSDGYENYEYQGRYSRRPRIERDRARS